MADESPVADTPARVHDYTETESSASEEEDAEPEEEEVQIGEPQFQKLKHQIVDQLDFFEEKELAWINIDWLAKGNYIKVSYNLADADQ